VTPPGAARAATEAWLRRQRPRQPLAATIRLRDDPFRLCLMALIVLTLSRLGGYFGILRQVRPALMLFASRTKACRCFLSLWARVIIGMSDAQ